MKRVRLIQVMLVLFLASSLLSSCVSKKEYTKLVDDYEKLTLKLKSCKAESEKKDQKIKALEKE